jgi:guanylate kinase
MEILEERLRKRRTERESELEERLQNALEEMKSASLYDFIVYNDRLEDAVNEIHTIIRNNCADGCSSSAFVN